MTGLFHDDEHVESCPSCDYEVGMMLVAGSSCDGDKCKETGSAFQKQNHGATHAVAKIRCFADGDLMMGAALSGPKKVLRRSFEPDSCDLFVGA